MSSAEMQNFGLFLHLSSIPTDHSGWRTKRDGPLCPPLLPSMSVTYLTSNERRLFWAARLWAARRRGANVLIRVGLGKGSAEGRASAGANCSCEVVGGVLWIYTRLGIPPPPTLPLNPPQVLEMLFSLCEKSPQRTKDFPNIESGPLNTIILKVQQNLGAGGGVNVPYRVEERWVSSNFFVAVSLGTIGSRICQF